MNQLLPFRRVLLFIITLFFTLNAFAQLPAFTFTVTPTDETCLNNGVLTFSVSGTVPGATMSYAVTLLPNTNVTTTTSTTVPGLGVGNYSITATQTFNGQTSTNTQLAQINNMIVPLSFILGHKDARCGNDGEITVSVTSGNAVTYEIIAGPVLKPAQASNVFTGLPAGLYSVRVTDTCGEAQVISVTLFQATTGITMDPFQFSGEALPSCNEVNILQSFKAPLGGIIFGPITVVITVHPPNGGAPIVITEVLPADGPSVDLITNIPYYNDQQYSFDIKVTDACGTVYNKNGNIINRKFKATGNDDTQGCGDNFFTINVSNYVAPITVTFLSAPVGFDPFVANTSHPFFNGGQILYGGVNNIYVPEGTYNIQVTDFCNHTETFTIETQDHPVPAQILGEPSNCLQGGKITILADDRDIVDVDMISGPAAYSATYPVDVNIYISEGQLVLTALPPGTYTFTATDECGEVTENLVYEVVISDISQVLTAAQRPGCEPGFGSLRLENSQVPLTDLVMTAAPAAFTEPLPFDMAAYIAGDGRAYMNSLPGGSYTFTSTNECGVQISRTLSLSGYNVTLNDFNIVKHCGSFDVLFQHSSNGNYAQGFYLQKYNPVEATWENPQNGTNYTEGTQANSSNSILLTNNGNNVSYAYTGLFRVLKTFFVYDNGGIGNIRCYHVIHTFTVEDGPVIIDAYSFPCEGGLTEVAVIAEGVPPLSYSITSKDGAPFTVNNGESNLFSGLESATYNFRVSDICGNIRNIQYDIDALEPIAIKADGFCEGEASSLSVPGFEFMEYEWYKEGAPGTILSTTEMLNFSSYDSATQSGVYHVNITTDNPLSCMNQNLSFTIEANSLPNAGPDVVVPFCNDGLALDLKDYLGEGIVTTGEWEDLDATGLLTNSTLTTAGLPEGSYQFRYTVNGFCNLADDAVITLEVKNKPQLPVISSNSPVCEGNDLTLTVSSIAGATYAWTGPNGFTSSQANPVLPEVTMATAGAYLLTVTVNECASATATVNIVVNAAPKAGNDANVQLCNNGEVVNLSDYLSESANADGVWQNVDNGGTLNGSQLPTSGVPQGTYHFKYTVVNNCDTDDAVITLQLTDIPQSPVISAIPPVCEGTDVQFTVNTITGGNYQWTGPNGFSSTEANPLLSNVGMAAAGLYSVIVSVNDCTSLSASVNIVVNAAPKAGGDAAIQICNEGTTLNLAGYLEALADAGGTWEDVDNAGTLNGAMLATTGIAQGIYHFKYTVTNICNITDEATITLQLTDIPQAPFVNTLAPVCEGTDIQLEATAVTNAVYNWAGPNGFTSNEQNPLLTAAGLAANGNYTLTVSVNGCQSDSTTIPVTIFALPQFDVEGNAVLCEGQTSELKVIPVNFNGAAVDYVWSLDGVTLTETSGTIQISEIGQYEVAVTNNNCTTSGLIDVVNNDNPFDIVLDSGCINYEYRLWVANIANIDGAVVTWTGPDNFSFTGTEANITNLPEGEYTATVTNKEGCTADATISINNTSCIIPRGISPNGDTMNDSFDLSNLDVREIKIFNRYGLKVYEAQNYKSEWHGQSDKGTLPTGTYYYVITLSAGKQVTGWVYLQREE